MPKILDAIQQREYDNSKNTFPNVKLITYEELVRLRIPKIFPTNESRLYNSITKKAIDGLMDLFLILNDLPESYKFRVLTSNEFDNFKQVVFEGMRVVDHKTKRVVKQSKTEATPQSFILYNQMLNYALEGLVRSMPKQFIWHFQQEISSVLLLMQSISLFAKSNNPKLKLPIVKIPPVLLNRDSITGGY